MGCGDDDEQVSAEELISRGDGICAEGRKSFDQVQAQAPANAAAAADQTDELVEIAADELNELREIRPPDELRDSYDSYLAARGEGAWSCWSRAATRPRTRTPRPTARRRPRPPPSSPSG